MKQQNQIYKYTIPQRRGLSSSNSMIYESIYTDPLIADIYEKIGQIYYAKRDYVKALIQYKNSMKIYRKHEKIMASIYFNIASIYNNKNDNNKALKIYRGALNESVRQELPHKSFIAKISIHMATVNA